MTGIGATQEPLQVAGISARGARIGVEHEVKFVVTEEQWRRLTDHLDLPLGDIVWTGRGKQSSIYFDTTADRLCTEQASLALIVNPGELADVGWMICKETVAWEDSIRHALELAVRVNPAHVDEYMSSSTPVAPLARAVRHLGAAPDPLVCRFVSVQDRQKALFVLPDGAKVSLSLDHTEFSSPGSAGVQHRYFVEVECNDFELGNSFAALTSCAEIITTELGVIPSPITKPDLARRLLAGESA